MHEQSIQFGNQCFHPIEDSNCSLKTILSVIVFGGRNHVRMQATEEMRERERKGKCMFDEVHKKSALHGVPLGILVCRSNSSLGGCANPASLMPLEACANLGRNMHLKESEMYIWKLVLSSQPLHIIGRGA